MSFSIYTNAKTQLIAAIEQMWVLNFEMPVYFFTVGKSDIKEVRYST